MFIPRPADIAGLADVGKKPSLTTKAGSWRPHVVQGELTVKAGTKTEVQPTPGKLTPQGGQKYAFHLLYADSVFPGELGKSMDDVIYVYGGHGLVDRDAITWPGESMESGSPIDSQQLATLLASKINNPRFEGRVKIYSCHSGETGATAFGKLVATKMRGLGYGACRYYGYIGEVTQQYETITKLKIRAYRGEDTEDVQANAHRFVLQQKIYVGRASGRAVPNRTPPPPSSEPPEPPAPTIKRISL